MKIARYVYNILAISFLLCLVVQAFIAGLAVFTDAVYWGSHTEFVRYFAFMPLVMFLLTFIAKIGGVQRWLSLGMFGAVIFQFLNIQALPSAAVLHPVIALILFAMSFIVVRNTAWRGTRGEIG